jgi:predicted nucleic acid-binding protein
LVPRDAWELSRRYDEHPICDLVYVALARRLGEVLLTADRKLVDRLRDPRVRLVG